MIFVRAVRLPGLMDTSPPIPGSDEPRAYSLSQYPDSADGYGQATTKRSLILVSKLWWNLSIDLFYEYVSLRRTSELHALVTALEMNIFRAAGSSTVSTYVRHLCISLPFFDRLDKRENNAIEKLFNIFQNIQILRIYSSLYVQTPLIIPRNKPLRFLRIEWQDYKAGYSVPLIKELDSSFNLQALQIDLTSTRDGTNIPESLSFPNLHTLRLTFKDVDSNAIVRARVANWELPPLLFAQLDLLPYQQPKQLFASHGPKLKSIHIHSMTVPVLTLIAQHCPMLEDLIVFKYYPQNHFPPVPSLAPRLRRVRVEKNLSIRLVEHFLERIWSMQRPLLQIIQVPQNYDDCTSADVSRIKELVDILGKENVRLEDGEGKLLDVSMQEYIVYEDSRSSLGA
jgi:hypothetical protein